LLLADPRQDWDLDRRKDGGALLSLPPPPPSWKLLRKDFVVIVIVISFFFLFVLPLPLLWKLFDFALPFAVSIMCALEQIRRSGSSSALQSPS
jgi:hypothetical protein